MKTSTALCTILRCHAVIIVNAARAVDTLVKAQPWAFVVGFALLAFITSSVCVGNARAERDHARSVMASMQDTIYNYRMLVESKEYAQNKY